MNDLRRKILLAHRELLEKQPYDEQGYRFTIIGGIFTLFGEDESDILAGMTQLAKDLGELGMQLSSFPHRSDLLCAMQKLNKGAINEYQTSIDNTS